MIIFPMMGLSSRFKTAGYEVPKYMLPTGTGSVFRRSVESFSKYFGSETFLFIIRAGDQNVSWIQKEITSLGDFSYSIVELSDDTLGQAHTVYLGLEKFHVDVSEPLTIFNIDTFRPEFVFPEFIPKNANWLEVFYGSGDHWSFIEPGQGNSVIRTAEKDRISEYCSDGIYGFSSVSVFNSLVLEAIECEQFVRGELYIAPLYNKLIAAGIPVFYSRVNESQIIFCGTPSEYKQIISEEK